ncbi:MAG: copper homeostasis protein CutC, partial [Terriglobales bacterium]
MSTRCVLEICVESVDHAVAAARGGADRLELCSELSSGGITPSAGLMQTTRRHVGIPIHILIRPRPGDFCYTEYELEMMRDDILAAKQIGMNGLVLGVLHDNQRIDVERARMLVEAARPLPVTFHRAFDLSKNPVAALEEVVQTGASRILTSGGKKQATDALSTLKRLAHAAKDRIVIMPCGGIGSANIMRIVRATSVREIHTSVGVSRLRSTGNGTRRSPANGSGPAGFRSELFEKKVGD